MKNNKLEASEKKYIKAVIEMYKFKNYDLYDERFNILDISRKISNDLDTRNDFGLIIIDEYIRTLI